jgi:hypothetical protein
MHPGSTAILNLVHILVIVLEYPGSLETLDLVSRSILNLVDRARSTAVDLNLGLQRRTLHTRLCVHTQYASLFINGGSFSKASAHPPFLEDENIFQKSATSFQLYRNSTWNHASRFLKNVLIFGGC